AVVGAEGGLAVVEGTGGQTQRGRHPAGRGFGPGADRLAPRDPAARGEADPGGEVLFRGPAGHVETDLGDDLEGRGRVDAIDPGEVDTGDAIEVLASIEGRFGPSDLTLAGRHGQGLAPALVLEPSELGLDLAITGGDLLLIELDVFHGLTQLEEVLPAPGALQRAGDRLLVSLAAAVA